MSSVPERTEIDEDYKWDLSSVYATDDDWQAAYEDLEERLADLRAYEGRATGDGETLREVLALRDKISESVETLTYYARMRRDEDTRDQDAQAMFSRAQTLASEAASATSFVEPAIQSLSEETLDRMVAETPGLETYEHYLDDVHRLKPHTRSAEVENLLAELSDVTGAAGDVYTMLLNADLTFPSVEGPDGEPVEVTQSNLTRHLRDPDRAFRRRVHETFYDELGDLRNTIATAYRSSVTADVKLARARNYETAREAALDGPNVPVEVYDNLVGTVRDNLPTLHRHADLKRDHLGVEELRMWDLYMPLADDDEPDVPYREAKSHVVDAMAPLGPDYQRRVKEGLESRWVDVYENRGKRSGAYSSGGYDTQPFILMNYQDDVDSMFTLAHELGHSLHSQLTSENQPFVYGSYEIFVAEVASTVNETLLTHHLLETADDEALRRHVLNAYLERFRSVIYRQTMFAEFEHLAHRQYEEGGALTADWLDGTYRDLKSDLYADADVDDRIAREWMRIPHFFRAFYVYQYSTGLSAAVSLARDVLEEGEPAAERYVEFLERGASAYPLELLADAGVDMTSPAPIERAIEVYDDYLDRMAGLL